MIFVFEECLEGNSDSCSKSNRSASSLEDYVYGYAVGFAEGMLAASGSGHRYAKRAASRIHTFDFGLLFCDSYMMLHCF